MPLSRAGTAPAPAGPGDATGDTSRAASAARANSSTYIDDALRPEAAGDDEAELRIAHLVHSPGSFCSAGSVPFTEESAPALA